MVEIRRILCPVDFSEASRHALQHAVAIARWYQSQVIAVHVVHAYPLPPPPILFAELSHSASAVPDYQSREAELRAWLAPAHGAGVKTDIVLDEGNPTACIIEHAKSRQADLIVMGTHGLSGFERLMLGSVAEKVLRKAPCPVMTVPPASVTTAKVPYARLLCPVDFSESSLAALRFASSLAEEADARLTILHVIDWPADEDLLVGRFDSSEFRQVVEQQARERLEALVTHDMRTWCKPATKMGHGKPYRQVLETADQEASDLIVIGVRGRNPLDLTLFGSTTNQVVRQATCPVLTLMH